MTTRPTRRRPEPGGTVGVRALVAGATGVVVVAAWLGAHQPTLRGYPGLSPATTATLKGVVAVAVLAAVAVQALTGLAALAVTGRGTPDTSGSVGRAARLFRRRHRLVGLATFSLALVVAWHCLWALDVTAVGALGAVHTSTAVAAIGITAAKLSLVGRPGSPDGPARLGLALVVCATLAAASGVALATT